jgi:hypothetical protein
MNGKRYLYINTGIFHRVVDYFKENSLTMFKMLSFYLMQVILIMYQLNCWNWRLPTSNTINHRKQSMNRIQPKTGFRSPNEIWKLFGYATSKGVFGNTPPPPNPEIWLLTLKSSFSTELKTFGSAPGFCHWRWRVDPARQDHLPHIYRQNSQIRNTLPFMETSARCVPEFMLSISRLGARCRRRPGWQRSAGLDRGLGVHEREAGASRRARPEELEYGGQRTGVSAVEGRRARGRTAECSL